jgi:hypothetical protein
VLTRHGTRLPDRRERLCAVVGTGALLVRSSAIRRREADLSRRSFTCTCASPRDARTAARTSRWLPDGQGMQRESRLLCGRTLAILSVVDVHVYLVMSVRWLRAVHTCHRVVDGLERVQELSISARPTCSAPSKCRQATLSRHLSPDVPQG